MHDFFFRAKRLHLLAVERGKKIYKDWGLTPARLDILFIVSRAGWVLQKDLWKELGLQRSTICKMLRRMRELDLVTTMPSVWNPRDREVRLTDQGILKAALCLKLAFEQGKVQQVLVDAFAGSCDAPQNDHQERRWESERDAEDGSTKAMPLLLGAGQATGNAIVVAAADHDHHHHGRDQGRDDDDDGTRAARTILDLARRMKDAADRLEDRSWLDYPVAPSPRLYAEHFEVLARMLLVSFIRKRNGRGMPMRDVAAQFAWAREVLRNRMVAAQEALDRKRRGGSATAGATDETAAA